VLAFQLLLGIIGLDHHVDFDHHASLGEASAGLNLLSVRSIAAGLAFFGVGGLAGLATPLGWLLAIPLSLVAGFGASVAVAAVMRSFGKLERDSSVQVESAIGATATVYLTIPGALQGAGKVHVLLGGRTVELQATTEGPSLRTGTAVLIVNLVSSDTVSVVADPVTESTLPASSSTTQIATVPPQ
jgi:membrane protein implicated in regulation of membrane protease activity